MTAPSATTITAEARINLGVICRDTSPANTPKPIIIGSVPRPKKNSIVAPRSALPLPAAMMYIACKGPHRIIRPFSKPITKG